MPWASPVWRKESHNKTRRVRGSPFFDPSQIGLIFVIHHNCGVGFPRPVDCIQIESIWVRGGMGPISIYVTKQSGGFREAMGNSEGWRRIFGRVNLPPSFQALTELKLPESVMHQPPLHSLLKCRCTALTIASVRVTVCRSSFCLPTVVSHDNLTLKSHDVAL
jgi:hypothetical protein